MTTSSSATPSTSSTQPEAGGLSRSQKIIGGVFGFASLFVWSSAHTLSGGDLAVTGIATATVGAVGLTLSYYWNRKPKQPAVAKSTVTTQPNTSSATSTVSSRIIVTPPPPPLPLPSLSPKPAQAPVWDRKNLCLRGLQKVCQIHGLAAADHSVQQLAAALQAIFFNDPTLIETLPQSILQRLKESELFTGNVDQMALDLFRMDQDKGLAFYALCNRLRNNNELIIKPIEIERFLNCLKTLKNNGWPDGINKKAAINLIVLLQLYVIIQKAMKPTPDVSRSDIEFLRGQFIPTAETSDIIKTLVMFITKGLPPDCISTTRRVFQDYSNLRNQPVQDETGKKIDNPKLPILFDPKRFYGLLPLVPGKKSVIESLQATLRPPKPELYKWYSQDTFETKGKVTFGIQEQLTCFSKCPEFLFLQNGHQDLTINDRFHLGKEFINGGKSSANYELYGVISENGTALVRKDSGPQGGAQCYSLTPNGEKMKLQNRSTFLLEAEAQVKGAILVYRKDPRPPKKDDCSMM